MDVPLDGARRRAHPNPHPAELIPIPIPDPDPDPEQVRVAELTGHTSRVLHMAQSPDGTTVVSAAADETLRFWRILGSDSQSRGHGRGESVLSSAAMSGASPSAWTVR